MNAPLLSVRDLTVEFTTRRGMVHVLDRVSFDVSSGEIVGIIGESGSGKSVTAYAVIGSLEHSARIRGGEVLFEGQDVLHLSRRARESWRGSHASIIFQNPRTALNPIRAVGAQIADVIARHYPGSAAEIRRQTLAAMRQVRIPDPERRMNAFPFELSGGLCQRIGIAMALACAPRMLIADEPTTGLDVTTQVVIMDLIRKLSREQGMSVALITHDVALAAEYCDRLVIMHAGHVVEVGQTEDITRRPRHPYTAGLLRSVPSLVDRIDELQAIGGSLPDLLRGDLPFCRFAERCDRRLTVCDAAALKLMPVDPTLDPEDPAQFPHLIACRNML